MRMKKRFLACAVLVIIFTLVTQSTLAYFSTSSTARNVITSGKIDVTLVEKTDTGAEFKDVSGVMPGQEVSKIVTVKNADDGEPAWVRIICTIEVKDAAGNKMALTEDELSKIIIPDYNTQKWEKSGGAWVYQAELATGAETEPLFTHVKFAEAMTNEYQGCEAAIHVVAQAVQAKNNPDKLGWPNS